MSISISDFVKLYPLRAKGLAWFFGAGSSVSAGVRSAYELTWDFKRICYCAEQSYPLHLYNLSDPGIKEQIQNYFDSVGNCPPLDDPEEYSFYFERAYPSAKDRSEYIARETTSMQLTHGHKVIGVLVKNNLLPLIFTTNFDKAFENIANAQFDKLEQWYCADLDNADSGIRYFQSHKRPLVVKLHGDYFSEKIKNTTSELQNQDERLRSILAVTLETNGLCVMGYSGRDESIMDLLIEAAKKHTTYPNGIFWFKKAGVSPLPKVIELIETARANGKQAEVIEIDTFDIAWNDIIKGFSDLPYSELEKLRESYPRLSNNPIMPVGRNYPLIRLNAIPIKSFPAIARIYKCNVGNTKEVKGAIAKSNAPLLAIRKRDGVVGFGADQDFVKAFSGYGHYEIDFFNLKATDLIYDDSALKGLLTSTLLKALTREKPLRSVKRREKYLLFPDPKKLNDPFFIPLKKVFDQLSGNVPRTKLTWVVALEVNVQYVLSNPLMLMSPTIIASRSSEKIEGALVAPFIKEYTARWYNQKFDEILNAWIKLIFAEQKEIEVTAFDQGINGVNATFELGRTSAFTRTN